MHIRAARVPCAAVIALLIAGAPAFGQQPAPPREPASDSVRALVEEAQQIQYRLARIQEKALERNPDLRAEGDSVQSSIDAAMREADPRLGEKLRRLDDLRSKFVEARRANDMEEARSLLREAQEIQKRVARTHGEVVKRKEIARRMEAFERRMLAAMNDVDPETDRLIARLDEIGSELDS